MGHPKFRVGQTVYIKYPASRGGRYPPVFNRPATIQRVTFNVDVGYIYEVTYAAPSGRIQRTSYNECYLGATP